jgi:hypothetical protein
MGDIINVHARNPVRITGLIAVFNAAEMPWPELSIRRNRSEKDRTQRINDFGASTASSTTVINAVVQGLGGMPLTHAVTMALSP